MFGSGLRFWLREARTPALLMDLAREFPDATRALAVGTRPLLHEALRSNEAGIEEALTAEAHAERAADRAYWTSTSFGFRATVFARVGQTFRLERSANLVDWVGIGVFTVRDPATVVQDGAALGMAGFYRVVLQ